MNRKNLGTNLLAAAAVSAGLIAISNSVTLRTPSSVSELEKRVERVERLNVTGSLPVRKIDERKNFEYAAEPHVREKEKVEASPYEDFKYQDEIPMILKHAERVGVDPELLMAIRSSENGTSHIAYGIIPQGNSKERYGKDKGYTLLGEFVEFESDVEKQLCWAAHTVKKNMKRFSEDSEGHRDFISYLASVYAPPNVDNDPRNLNENWEHNVRSFYDKFEMDE